MFYSAGLILEFKKLLISTPKNFDVGDLEWSLAPEKFKISPGSAKVQQNLRAPTLKYPSKR